MPFKREFKQITLPSLIEKGPGAYRKGDLCYRCRGPAGPETHILRECQADPDESWKEGSVARDCGENTEEPKVRKAVEKEFVRLLGEYRIRNNQIHHRYPAEIIAEKGNAAFQSSNTSTAPSQGPAATGKAPVVGEQGSTVPGKMKTSASASNTQKGNGKSQQNTGKPKERKLLNAASQGKLNAQVYNEPMKAVGPKIVPGGIYPNKVDALEGDNLITSNYVVIEEIPDKLYRYSLSFWRPGANDTQVAYNKRRDIKSAFKASTYNGEPDKRLQDTNYSQKLDLSQLNWATNFNELWTTTSIQNHAQDLGPFLWTPPGRKRIKDLWMTVRPQRHLDNVQESFKTKQAHELSDEIRALNAIIAHSINEGDATNAIEQVGANKFFLKAGYSSIRGSCLLLKRGYFSSIRPSKLGPLLNINTATSAFLPSLTVRDLVQKVQCGGGADYAAKLLRGSYLRIAYNRPEFEGGVKLNEEEHRVKEFVQFGRSAVQQKFVKDGALVSVFDFFGTFMQGKNPEFNSIKNDLCVNVGTPVRTKKRSDEEWDDLFRIQSQKKPVWIPARLLQILPNQSIKVVLGATEAGEMIRTACRQPMGNAALIDQEGLFKLGIKGDQTHLEKLGLKAHKDLIAFPAEKLPTPTLLKLHDAPFTPYNATWNLARVQFPEKGYITEFGILPIANDAINDQELDLTQLSNNLKTRADFHGVRRTGSGRINIGTNQWNGALGPATTQFNHAIKGNADSVVEFHQNDISMPLGVIDGWYAKLERIWNLKLDAWFPNRERGHLTVAVLRVKDETEYSILKRAADLRYGRHLICMQLGKVNAAAERKEEYLSNICMKINMKGKGVNHKVKFDQIGWKSKETMILGADVTHPSVLQPRGYPSIACVVGSIDDNFANYPGSMRLQAGRQEKIEEMRNMVQERIRAWSEHHSNGLPKNIIFFRDGVSESQFETCNTHEVSEIEHAYNEICIERGIPSGQLKLTFVIAGKRHNTRFYPTESTQAYSFEKNTNVAPGLLVNDFITDPIRDKGLVKCDFYLQSHWAIQGTARSAHYHVLRDDLKFQGNQLQTLTHQLCYSFARATKGVSYVSPAYIADRLCERGRVYLRGWKPSDDFNEPKDENGNEIKEEKDIKLWKQGKARAVAQSALWGGRYNDDPANGPIRRNPWHTDLDDTMFWM